MQLFSAVKLQNSNAAQSSSHWITAPGTQPHVVGGGGGGGGAGGDVGGSPQFSSSPTQACQLLNSEPLPQVCVPSWQAPTLRMAAGPVQHGAVLLVGQGQPAGLNGSASEQASLSGAGAAIKGFAPASDTLGSGAAEEPDAPLA
jgi:hypothetical protein